MNKTMHEVQREQKTMMKLAEELKPKMKIGTLVRKKYDWNGNGMGKLCTGPDQLGVVVLLPLPNGRYPNNEPQPPTVRGPEVRVHWQDHTECWESIIDLDVTNESR